jgi:hypothetical protein
MNRYYFYHASYLASSASGDVEPLQGEVHGIWIVEDESTPDIILAAIEAWLYEEWEKKAQGGSAPPSVTYAITQFNLVQ